jgi:hypothetical protein
MKVILEYTDSANRQSVHVKGSWDNWTSEIILLPTIRRRWLTTFEVDVPKNVQVELEFKFIVDCCDWKTSKLYPVRYTPDVGICT